MKDTQETNQEKVSEKKEQWQPSIYDSGRTIQKGEAGFLNEFLWLCAGVNRRVLRQCPTDYAKYAGIGGTILFTALMAMLSGGYALYFVFKSIHVAIAFGIFWGLLIFNLDRFIVNTMYSDGKVTISWREFYSGLPRIIMAIFLGVVISTPLELKIFESEIDVRIGEKVKEKIDSYKAEDKNRIDSLTHVIAEIREKPDNLPQQIALTGQASLIQSDLNAKQVELNGVRQSIQTLKIQRSSYDVESSQYIKLTSAINAKYGKLNQLSLAIKQLQGELGAISVEYRSSIAKAENQKEELIATIQSQIEDAKKNLENSKAYTQLISDEYGGLEARMEAFHDLRKSWSTDISAWFIMFLFIIIETAPTFFKMMIASGPYDDLLRAEMHRVRVLSDKRISDINDQINTEVQISTKKNQERLEAELLANKKIMEQIATAQAELLQTAIEAWRKEELAKIKENPSEYIKSNNKV